MEKIYPEGPYLLIGYCGGGLIAYEIARQLMERGKQIKLLAMCESYPQNRFKRRSLKQTVLGFISLSFEEKKLVVLMLLKSYQRKVNKLFTWKNKELANRIGNVDNSFHYSSFKPKAYEGDVIFFEALIKESGDIFCYCISAKESWKELITKNLELHEIPSNHFNILLDPDNAKMVAEILKSRLSKISDQT